LREAGRDLPARESQVADTRLREFIEAALRAGKSRDEIAATLTAAGWSAEQIAHGLMGFADLTFVVPVPRPRAQLSARDAFFYLLLFATLYITAYQLGSMLFSFINLALPMPGNSYEAARAEGSIRWATASLIVAFPLFLVLSVKLSREIRLDPARRLSSVRRWLIYLTMFVASGVIVGDAISLVYNLLSGEITVRFVLKVLVVAAITGTVFAYFLKTTRCDALELSS
jgi:Domain of unknown function (DUF5671)